jgi:hypothetical protein
VEVGGWRRVLFGEAVGQEEKRIRVGDLSFPVRRVHWIAGKTELQKR